MAYYGVSLFAAEILSEISSYDDDVSSNRSIQKVSSQQMIGNAIAIPAVILTIYLMQKVGTKTLQVIGFVMIAVGFFLLAAAFTMLQNKNPEILFIFYCFLLFCLSFGPCVTTYVLSAEMYPREIRSTFSGISAACGKLGAVVGMFRHLFLCITIHLYPSSLL